MFYISLDNGVHRENASTNAYGPIFGPLVYIGNYDCPDGIEVFLNFCDENTSVAEESDYIFDHALKHKPTVGIYYDGYQYLNHRILAGPMSEHSFEMRRVVKFSQSKANWPED